MKSDLIKPSPLESGASISAHWNVNKYLSQFFDVTSQRRQKAGWFYRMTMHTTWIQKEILT